MNKSLTELRKEDKVLKDQAREINKKRNDLSLEMLAVARERFSEMEKRGLVQFEEELSWGGVRYSGQFDFHFTIYRGGSCYCTKKDWQDYSKWETLKKQYADVPRFCTTGALRTMRKIMSYIDTKQSDYLSEVLRIYSA